MDLLNETTIGCPYCGERITILVDVSAGQQRYVEDCQVCCNPMNIQVDLDFEGHFSVEARGENDSGL